ncbi:hypothetical protein O181_062247 [Austropuccinia psidii MF-1]|uniref:No apical meristem-associated C-terminal domain-containing protein n=1 Tax=Austropuccinia psidii MF-1 TaxID=1389203 RepID=A0A9Q3EMA7_9BASI|nr:hypothetical protein [Austropuccinia psidii MF-1]
MEPKLTNYAILKLIILFCLQTELKPPQEASVDIYKASQKAYKNALQHKEYQILVDLWKNCMNSYLTVRKFLGHPNTCKLLNGWHPLMDKKNIMEEKQPSTTQASAKNSPSSQKQQFQHEKQPKTHNKDKGKAPATNPYSQGYRTTKIQQDAMENVFQMARTMMELQKKEGARSKYQELFLIF